MTPSARQALIHKIAAIVRQYEAGAAPEMSMKRVAKAFYALNEKPSGMARIVNDAMRKDKNEATE